MKFKTGCLLFCLFFSACIYADDCTCFLNNFYCLKKSNQKLAERSLLQAIQTNPCNAVLYKEMGYFLLAQKRGVEALPYFQSAEKLDPCDVKIILQIAYLLDTLGRKREAYYKFAQVSSNPDPEAAKIGHIATINLAGCQTRILPEPFFADLYFAPFYMQRFRDAVFPGQARIGITYGKEKQGELYGTIYFTRDTRSRSIGTNPIIYADNAIVYGVGTRYRPWQKIPIFGYFEIGRAYILAPLARKPVNQGDVRYGLTGYMNWGSNLTYRNCWCAPFTHMGDVYGNFGYYSRYYNDWIGQLRVRDGFKIAEYKNSILQAYVKGQIFWDTKHYFYNNVLEVGPGIAFIPDNRWNLVVRAELVHGYYLPVNSPMPNPYSANYNNGIIELDTYFRF